MKARTRLRLAAALAIALAGCNRPERDIPRSTEKPADLSPGGQAIAVPSRNRPPQSTDAPAVAAGRSIEPPKSSSVELIQKVIPGAESKAVLSQLGWPQRVIPPQPARPGGAWEYECADGTLVLELSSDGNRVVRAAALPRTEGPAGGPPRLSPGSGD